MTRKTTKNQALAERFLKPIKANVRRYQAGTTSYLNFFYRAERLWTMAWASAASELIEAQYARFIEPGRYA